MKGPGFDSRRRQINPVQGRTQPSAHLAQLVWRLLNRSPT